MSREITIGNPPIAVQLRRSNRAKRLSLRVSRLDGRVTLTMPPRGAERDALAFLKEREAWLQKHVGAVAPKEQPQIGEMIMYRGVETPIQAGAVKRAVVRDGAIIVPDQPNVVGVRIKALLKLAARDALAYASDEYAEAVDRSYNRLSIRDTRSRWGSCSSQGVLMYSWRLIMAPPHVLDYVAAHEVSHLVEMNHSPDFWAVVASLMPDYEEPRKWLRKNGDQLHRVQFGD